MKHIRIERKGGMWVAMHRATDYPEIGSLFGPPDMNGEVGISTPYFETMHADEVVAQLQPLNPDAFVYFRETISYA